MRQLKALMSRAHEAGRKEEVISDEKFPFERGTPITFGSLVTGTRAGLALPLWRFSIGRCSLAPTNDARSPGDRSSPLKGELRTIVSDRGDDLDDVGEPDGKSTCEKLHDPATPPKVKDKCDSFGDRVINWGRTSRKNSGVPTGSFILKVNLRCIARGMFSQIN